MRTYQTVITRTILFTITFALTTSAAIAAGPDYDQPPINYSTTAPQDPVAQLQRDIDAGKVDLAATPTRGYLDALLKALDIPPASQTLVFSKTSFQRNLISPKNPRALYFNDDTYVGYVPGGDVIEIATTDPKLGSVFYTFAQRAGAKQSLARQTDNCLQCHGESMTRNTPGLLVRSVFPDADGQPILSAGTFITTHESPLPERWGGWYVTGAPATLTHMGNAHYTADENQNPVPQSLVPSRNQSFDATKYPTATSDIVALLVLEHQTEAHNRITRAHYGTLLALRDEKIISEAMGEKLAPGQHSESTLNRIKGVCQPLVEYMLFAGEAPLASPADGTSPFAADFAARGPRDSQGRSLRDFDLKSRLFRQPCSYLIYSPSFDGLPDPARGEIYKSLWAVLCGKDTRKPFAHLTLADRTAIAEIIRETKPELREAWKSLESPEATP